MKKALKNILILSVLAVVLFSPAAYARRLEPTGDVTQVLPSSVNSFLDVQLIFYRILKWIYTAFFLVAIIFILLAAYNFLLGGRDEKKIAIAKNQLKYAIIAIVVALVAGGIHLIVAGFLITGH